MIYQPFDYLNSITETKKDIIGDSEILEKDYQAYLVNKGLSYFPDTIFYSNVMNLNSHLSKKMQYDYLMGSITKKKRFSKWFKKDENDILDCICFLYNYSREKAEEALKILTSEQKQKIMDIVYGGGPKHEKSS